MDNASIANILENEATDNPMLVFAFEFVKTNCGHVKYDFGELK